MKKYWWVILVSALFALGSCAWKETSDIHAVYPIQGITAYQGQDVTSLLDDNGAPNTIQNLPDGKIAWIYYTNFRPVGGGELISYDNPSPQQAQTTCMVKVILYEDAVEQVISNCQ